MYVVLRPRGTKCTELLIDPIYPSLVLLFFFVSYYSVRIYKRGKVYMDIDTYLQISIHRCLSVFIYRYLSMSRIDDWRRQWHPTPVLLPGKSHGQRSLVGCSPGGRWELNRAQWLHFHFSLSYIGEGNGNPLQCSCLENPREGGAWWAAIYGVAESQTRLKQLSSSSSSWTLKSELYRMALNAVHKLVPTYPSSLISTYLASESTLPKRPSIFLSWS